MAKIILEPEKLKDLITLFDNVPTKLFGDVTVRKAVKEALGKEGIPDLKGVTIESTAQNWDEAREEWLEAESDTDNEKLTMRMMIQFCTTKAKVIATISDYATYKHEKEEVQLAIRKIAELPC